VTAQRIHLVVNVRHPFVGHSKNEVLAVLAGLLHGPLAADL